LGSGNQKKVREALLPLGATLPDSKNMFGAKDQVRSGAVPDRLGHGVGRQSRKESHTSQLDAN